MLPRALDYDDGTTGVIEIDMLSLSVLQLHGFVDFRIGLPSLGICPGNHYTVARLHR